MAPINGISIRGKHEIATTVDGATEVAKGVVELHGSSSRRLKDRNAL